MKITLNGEPYDLDQSLTIAGLLERLGMTGRPVAVEVNRQLVPRAEHDGCQLAEADEVEVVTLVGGG